MKSFFQWSLLGLLIISATIALANSTKVIVGYYPAWARYSGVTPARIPVKNIDFINYAFGGIDQTTCKITTLDAWADSLNFPELTELKKTNPSIKILYSIGGWNNSNGFYSCTKSEKVDTLVKSIVTDVLKAHSDLFDGIDLDWEFPVAGGAPDQMHSPEDKDNYTVFVQKLRQELTKQFPNNKKYLTIAGPGAIALEPTQSASITNLDLKVMEPYLDFVNMMAYDYYGATWQTKTNNLAPLYRDPLNTSPDASVYNVDAGVQGYIKQGFPANKLVMGIPAYGSKWQNVTEEGQEHGLFFDTKNLGQTISYQDMMDFLNGDTKTNIYTNENSGAAVYYDHYELLSLETPRTIELKKQYIDDKQLLGAMFWDIAKDACMDNSLIYQMRNLESSGAVKYPCLPKSQLELTDLSGKYGAQITVADGVDWYTFDYQGAGVSKVYTAQSSDNVMKLLNKKGLQILVSFAGKQLWCNNRGDGALSQDGADMKFDFTSTSHIMVTPYDDGSKLYLKCDVKHY